MKKSIYFESDGEVIVADGVTVRVVTSNQVISVTGGASVDLSLKSSEGALERALRARMFSGMAALDVAFRDMYFGQLAAEKPVVGLTRVRVAYDVLLRYGFVPDRRGIERDFIHEAIRLGWWSPVGAGTEVKFTVVKRRAWWLVDHWEGDALCVALAKSFCRLLV